MVQYRNRSPIWAPLGYIGRAVVNSRNCKCPYSPWLDDHGYSVVTCPNAYMILKRPPQKHPELPVQLERPLHGVLEPQVRKRAYVFLTSQDSNPARNRALERLYPFLYNRVSTYPAASNCVSDYQMVPEELPGVVLPPEVTPYRLPS